MKLIKQSNHIKAEEQAKADNNIVSSTPASIPMHMSENELRQRLQLIYLHTQELISDMKRKRDLSWSRSMNKNEDMDDLIYDTILHLENILSLCDHAW